MRLGAREADQADGEELLRCPGGAAGAGAGAATQSYRRNVRVMLLRQCSKRLSPTTGLSEGSGQGNGEVARARGKRLSPVATTALPPVCHLHFERR